MIRIITGEKNSGKSRLFRDLYLREGAGEPALYSQKLTVEGVVCGYDLLLLPSLKRLRFVSLRSSVSPDPATYETQGRFAFLKKAFRIGEEHILSFPDHLPVWIDEIGLLEINDGGYASLLKRLLAAERDVTITLRSQLLDSLLQKYGITSYRLETY